MKKMVIILSILAILIISIITTGVFLIRPKEEIKTLTTTPTITQKPSPTNSPTPQVTKPQKAKRFFKPTFANNLIIEEKDSPGRSNSIDFWLNSGGQLTLGNGTAKTIQNEVPQDSYWRRIYKSSNPQDTDEGKHPQNIFRLVTRSLWHNFEEQVYFKVNADNPSKSPNRNSSNGLFLFNRYQDGDNLYYTGARVDGEIVVKKKYKGAYYTLGETKFFPGAYDSEKSPNLLPKNSWIGIKSTVSNVGDSVVISVFIDTSSKGEWIKAIEVYDKTPDILKNQGNGGIRTDFMDVELKDFMITES